MSIKDISQGISQIAHIEKVGLFCFTVIGIVAMVKWTEYSLSTILISLALMIHFIFIGFFRTEHVNSRIDEKDPTKTITITQSHLELLRRNEGINPQLKYLVLIRNILLTFAIIIIIITYFKSFF